MEWCQHDKRGKGNPYEHPCFKYSEDCGIIGTMKTVENKALMRIYRKDLTMPTRINAAIRRATSTGRPLGSEGFIKKLERIIDARPFSKERRPPKEEG